MTRKRDALAAALRGMGAPPLDPGLAERTLARARAHLAPASDAASPARRLRLTLAGALVPGLLASAAVDRAAETVAAIEQIYGDQDRD
jgi:hypothetical protein